MVRLLCVIHDFRGRGAERVLSSLLEHFDRGKFEIAVLVYHNKFAMPIPADIVIIPANIDISNSENGIFGKLKNSISKILITRRALSNYRPDLVLSVAGGNFEVMIAKYLYRAHVKVILSEHIIPSSFKSYTNRGMLRLGWGWLISVLYPLAELIIVPSKAVFNDLVTSYRISSKKIRIIPNPINIREIQRYSKNEIPLFLPHDSFLVGFVGNLSWEKNIPCLLKAMHSLRTRGINTHLMILGQGPEKGSLQRLSQSMGIEPYVHFMGFQEKPYGLMSRFDVLVIPSFYESFSCVMFEAMACGVPVISSKWVGSDDMCRDMEDCMLVPMNDEESLSSALLKIFRDEKLRKKLVRNGLALVNKCDVRKVAFEYEQTFQSVLNS